MSDAFLHFGLLPLQCRRDIAALGVLHKCALGLAPLELGKFFPLAGATVVRTHTRWQTHKHDKQLLDPISGASSELARRSLFGHVAVYNKLPRDLVAVPGISAFQRRLTHAVRFGFLNGWGLDWLSRKSLSMGIVQFQMMFGSS